MINNNAVFLEINPTIKEWYNKVKEETEKKSGELTNEDTTSEGKLSPRICLRLSTDSLENSANTTNRDADNQEIREEGVEEAPAQEGLRVITQDQGTTSTEGNGSGETGTMKVPEESLLTPESRRSFREKRQTKPFQAGFSNDNETK
jgi:hypothetical protein